MAISIGLVQCSCGATIERVSREMSAKTRLVMTFSINYDNTAPGIAVGYHILGKYDRK